jgi:hypothetical protein
MAVSYGAVKAPKTEKPKKGKKRRRVMMHEELTAETAITPRQMAEVKAGKRKPRKVVKPPEPTARQRVQAARASARTAARGGY